MGCCRRRDCIDLSYVLLSTSYGRLYILVAHLRAFMDAYPLPAPAARALTKLGRDISLARRRRRLSQASLAQRSGIGLNTLRRLEKGQPSCSIEQLARVLHVFGEIERLERLIDTGE